MQISQVITKKPVTLPVTSKLIDAAKLMAGKKIGLVVLTDLKDKRRILGVISERDIIRALAKGLSLKQPVKTVSTKKIITVSQEDDIGKAAKLFAEKKIRHLVIVDKAGKLISVLSIRDLLGEQTTLKAIVSSYGPEPVAGVD